MGDGFYKSKANDKNRSQNYFDRGHLIARRYNQWGVAEEEAKRGERDTYLYTTIHPQVGELNQGHWEDLESFIIDSGKLDVDRVSILAGAVLSSSDPEAVYEDAFTYESQSLSIPEVYWKVVYYLINGELRKIAFLMSQKEILSRLPMMRFPPQKKDLMLKDPFEKLQEPLKAYIVNSQVIENATGLQFLSATELYKEVDPLEVVDTPKATERDIFGVSAEFNFSKYI